MNDDEQLLDALQAATTHWQVHARCVSSYLRGRGLDWLADDPAAYGLGYAPYQWTELVDTLKSRGFVDATIEDAGLAARTSDGRLIDRFRGRLMFPIRHHETGRVVGATGRDLTQRPTTPKYLNTPTTRVFEKRRFLYGLSEQASSLRTRHTLVVTEGPLDALAIHGPSRVGIATCGTALTLEQVTALASQSSSNRVVLAFDGDRAGIEATIRAYGELVHHFPLVDYLVLEPGTDPAQSARRLAEPLNQPCRPVADLIIDERLANIDPSDAFAAINAVRRAVRSLVDLPPREWMPQISRISKRSKLEPAVVKDCLIAVYQPPSARADDTITSRSR